MAAKFTVIGTFNPLDLTVSAQGSPGAQTSTAQSALTSISSLQDAVNIQTTGSQAASNFIDKIVEPKKKELEELKKGSKSFQAAKSLNDTAKDLTDSAFRLLDYIQALENDPSDPDVASAVEEEIETFKDGVKALREEFDDANVDDPALEDALKGLEKFAENLELDRNSDGGSDAQEIASVQNSSGNVSTPEASDAANLARGFQTRANFYEKTIGNELKLKSDNANLDISVESSKGARLGPETAENLVREVGQQILDQGIKGFQRVYGDGGKIVEASINLLQKYGIGLPVDGAQQSGQLGLKR